MNYTHEQSTELAQLYLANVSTKDLAAKFLVPERSIIAKLSHLGVYIKRRYLTKRGETPVKKLEYIDRLANLLDVPVESLESLEKVNKNILALLERRLLNIAD